MRRLAVTGDGDLVLVVFGQDEFHVSPLFGSSPVRDTPISLHQNWCFGSALVNAI
jgi:hypothetical protein